MTFSTPMQQLDAKSRVHNIFPHDGKCFTTAHVCAKTVSAMNTTLFVSPGLRDSFSVSHHACAAAHWPSV